MGARAGLAASAMLHGLALAALLRADPAAPQPPRPPPSEMSLVLLPVSARHSAVASRPAAAARAPAKPAAAPAPPPRPARSRPARVARPAPRASAAFAASDPALPAAPVQSEARATTPSLTAARPAGGAQWHCHPDYPSAARRRGEEGTVLLRVAVAGDGSAAAASVAQSSGHDALDAAATEAILRECRFVPAMLDGRPIPGGVVLVPIVFRLDG